MARHPVQGVNQARPVLRHGEAPVIRAIASDKERLSVIREQAECWLSEGWQNIAVIVKTAKAAKALHRALVRELPSARLVSQGDESFEGGVQVMDAGVVKGLEFDCVLIADAEDAVYPDERFYAKLFYVLCTRPLHRLCFLHAGQRTRHLQHLTHVIS